MKLYLCEKPSQGRDLAAVLNVKKSEDGYMHDGGEIYVTWAFGHLLEQLSPDEYDQKYKKWSLDTLPIIPEEWKQKAKPKSAAQLKIVGNLIKKAKTVYIATDYDREGEAIARSLLDQFHYRGNVVRVCLTALDEKSIKKALESPKQGSETENLYESAKGRQQADWLMGMNITRLYTVLARSAGYDKPLHFGRVQTPTINLVCERDKAIKNFVPVPFFDVYTNFSVEHGAFQAKWIPPENVSDPAGRCLKKEPAQLVADQVNESMGSVVDVQKETKKKTAPLPLDLTSLQQVCNNKWGYSAQTVLDAAQSLYETHKITSYPRTDCRYIPESQHSDAPEIIAALVDADATLKHMAGKADIGKKSKAFNDKKITAHHAIIPTTKIANISTLSDTEENVYNIIRLHYLAQFLNEHIYDETKVKLDCNGYIFAANGRTIQEIGWKEIFGNKDPEESSDESETKSEAVEQTQNQKLPRLILGEQAQVSSTEIIDKKTKPLPHFTEASLLAAMENVARFVDDDRLKKVLKETAGIGTPATRANMIENAIDRGYLARSKKKIVATDRGLGMVSIYPKAITSPGMTALWETNLEKVANGEMSLPTFTGQISNYIAKIIEQTISVSDELTKNEGVIAKALSIKPQDRHNCFDCDSSLRRVRGKFGYFWGCQNASCNSNFKDDNGKPVKPIVSKADLPDCPDCGKKMQLRESKKGKSRGETFFGCSGYPECKAIIKADEAEKEAI